LSPEAFERCALLAERGIEHGFAAWRPADHALPRIALARQVHGERALEVLAPGEAGEADALFTRVPGLAVGVWTADCVPILLAHAGGRGVAAIHAGWRGSAREIARTAAVALAKLLAVEARDLLAVIGPHIGPCCYEVDEPVRQAIADREAFLPGRRSGHYQLDLHGLNRRQLLAAGLQPERVWGSSDRQRCACTACDAARYPSFRRDGGSARMLHYIRMRGV
jgi:YfiH family protein